MFIGIRDGKIWDICNPLRNKRTRDDGIPLTKEELSSIIYIEMEMKDFIVGDTWDFEKNDSLYDSPMRSLPPDKIPTELLQEKINELESRIEELEKQPQTNKKLLEDLK